MRTHLLLVFLGLIWCTAFAGLAYYELQRFDASAFPKEKFTQEKRRVDRGPWLPKDNVDWYVETEAFKQAKQDYEAKNRYFEKVFLAPWHAFGLFVLLSLMGLVRFFKRKEKKWLMWMELLISASLFLPLFAFLGYFCPFLDTVIYESTKDPGFRSIYSNGRMLMLPYYGGIAVLAFIGMIKLYGLAHLSWWIFGRMKKPQRNEAQVPES